MFKNKIKIMVSAALAVTLALTMFLFSSCTEEEKALYEEMLKKAQQSSQISSEDCDTSEITSDKATENKETSSNNTSQPPASSKQEANNNNSQTTNQNQTPSVSKPPVSSQTPSSSKPPVSSQTPSSSKPPVSSQTPVSPKPPVSSQPTSSYTAPVNENDMGAIEDRIIVLVNELRASVGVAPLAKNNKLSQSAYMRSKEMLQTGQFSHTRPDGTSCFTTMDAVGYKYRTVGENIGYTKGHAINTIAQVMFDGWKNSPGHYANMVKADFKEIGVSVCTDGITAYGTQHFGTQQ